MSSVIFIQQQQHKNLTPSACKLRNLTCSELAFGRSRSSNRRRIYPVPSRPPYSMRNVKGWQHFGNPGDLRSRAACKLTTAVSVCRLCRWYKSEFCELLKCGLTWLSSINNPEKYKKEIYYFILYLVPFLLFIKCIYCWNINKNEKLKTLFIDGL